MEHKDKRLIGDNHKKEWIVSLIDGDTETHYVQPVISEAVFDTKHEAMEEARYVIDAFRRLNPDNAEIKERYDYEDFVQIKLEWCGEYWLTVRCVVKGGTIDLSRELGCLKQIK